MNVASTLLGVFQHAVRMPFIYITGLIVLIYFFYPRSKWESAVMLYVAFMPLTAILKQSDQIFGFVDNRSIVSILVIATFYFNISRSESPKIRQTDNLKKISIFLVVFIMFFVERYLDIKESIIYGSFDIDLHFKRLVRDIIYFYALILIIIRMNTYFTMNGIDNGLLLGVFIAFLSMLFYDFFLTLGFRMHYGDEYFELSKDISQRLTGFLGENANVASIMFNLIAGYAFARNERAVLFSKKHLILLTLCFICILLCASRTGLFVFFVLFLLYSSRTFVNFKKFVLSSIFIGLLALFSFNHVGSVMEERFYLYFTGEEDTLSSRRHYWRIYLRDLVANPHYLIVGTFDKPPFHRAPHNTFINYLYFSGLLISFVFFYKLWQLYFYRNTYSSHYLYFTPLYTLIAFLIGCITGASILSYWFIIIIAASSGISGFRYRPNYV